MRYLLSIDPGKHCLGWAVWEDGKLISCGLERTKAKTLGGAILELYDGMPICDRAVVELPRKYPYERRVRANDLIDLGAVAGAAAVCVDEGGELEFVYPAQWKGQTPKKIQHRRTRDALSEEEEAVLEQGLLGVPESLRHNVLDAVGIGQWRIRNG